jgi:hypothetical protein
MDAVCEELENQMEELGAFVDEKLIDIKHIVHFSHITDIQNIEIDQKGPQCHQCHGSRGNWQLE